MDGQAAELRQAGGGIPLGRRPGGNPASPRTADLRRSGAGAPERAVFLIGAGNIAAAHAQALRATPGVRVAAVIDPNLSAAQRLAATTTGAGAYATVEAAIAQCGVPDAAHVLVPPDLHYLAALPLIERGCAVLVEKPFAVSLEQCDDLLRAAERSGARLGVNQNFVFHPAFRELRAHLSAGTYGPLRFLDCIYNMPLRQLAARQFGHWMFDRPSNILLEQAVHPLSQLQALAGPIREAKVLTGPSLPVGGDGLFFPTITASLTCESAPAQLRLAVGQSFPFWQLTAVCEDGVIVADMLSNRCVVEGRTRWLEAVDRLIVGARAASSILGATLRNAAGYVLSTVRLTGPSDPFHRSMLGSIGAFHAAVAADGPLELDGAFGRQVVLACDTLAKAAFGASDRARAGGAPRPQKAPPAEVAVLGGTGFIGAATIERLLADGRRVAVLARTARNLPACFDDPRVALHRGDIRDVEAVGRAVAGVPVVVNLAHGGGGDDYAAVEASMVRGAEVVARACLAHGVGRLVHVSSIAALYLGPQPAVLNCDQGPDPRAKSRAHYARAKAACEAALLELHACEGLPVCILRPGLVVGAGASPFHTGLGVFNNDQHCIGWNDGRNPLPFVLVEDVAAAIVQAAFAEEDLDGRCYNLVGDVRPTARDYIAALAQATGRPLRYHPSRPSVLWGVEAGKWLVKRAAGRAAPWPARHDILSRGLAARFDCSDVQRDLGWTPNADPEVFRRRAIEVHAG